MGGNANSSEIGCNVFRQSTSMVAFPIRIRAHPLAALLTMLTFDLTRASRDRSPLSPTDSACFTLPFRALVASRQLLPLTFAMAPKTGHVDRVPLWSHTPRPSPLLSEGPPLPAVGRPFRVNCVRTFPRSPST